MSYNANLKVQYEIMEFDKQADKENAYIPNLQSLIEEAPNEAMAKAWKEVEELIKKTKDSDFPFKGFTFRVVYTHQKKDGSYTIYQHGVPDEWDHKTCEKDILNWIEKVEL